MLQQSVNGQLIHLLVHIGWQSSCGASLIVSQLLFHGFGTSVTGNLLPWLGVRFETVAQVLLDSGPVLVSHTCRCSTRIVEAVGVLIPGLVGFGRSFKSFLDGVGSCFGLLHRHGLAGLVSDVFGKLELVFLALPLFLLFLGLSQGLLVEFL